jgi:hypothetical protein
MPFFKLYLSGGNVEFVVLALVSLIGFLAIITVLGIISIYDLRNLEIYNWFLSAGFAISVGFLAIQNFMMYYFGLLETGNFFENNHGMFIFFGEQFSRYPFLNNILGFVVMFLLLYSIV